VILETCPVFEPCPKTMPGRETNQKREDEEDPVHEF
jgi:hypothetical protein